MLAIKLFVADTIFVGPRIDTFNTSSQNVISL